jgi:hypothetical protein
MKDSMGVTTHHQRQGNINKLLTPEMQQQIRELKDELDEYLPDVGGFCDLLENIREATFIARQSAACLLTKDPFGAWEKIREQDEFDDFSGSAEKQNTKRNHPAKANVEKLITPEMRQQIIKAKKRLDDYANGVGAFIDDVKKIKSFGLAIELADDLAYDEPLETLEMRKKREQEEVEDGEFFEFE